MSWAGDNDTNDDIVRDPPISSVMDELLQPEALESLAPTSRPVQHIQVSLPKGLHHLRAPRQH